MLVEFLSLSGEKQGNLSNSFIKNPFELLFAKLPSSLLWDLVNLKPYLLLWFHSEKENLAGLEKPPINLDSKLEILRGNYFLWQSRREKPKHFYANTASGKMPYRSPSLWSFMLALKLALSHPLLGPEWKHSENMCDALLRLIVIFTYCFYLFPNFSKLLLNFYSEWLSHCL